MNRKPQIKLRRAHNGDGPALSRLALASKAVHGYDAEFMTQCAAELTFGPATIRAGETWVAEDHIRRVRGFYDLRDDNGVAEVYAIFVAPDALGEGIGRQLWRHLEGRAHALGLTHLGVDADPNAVGFYEACGCRIVGEAPSGSIPGRMLPRMAKDLRRPTAA